MKEIRIVRGMLTKGDLVLVQVRANGQLALPGGLAPDGESNEDALKRMLTDMLGAPVQVVRHLGETARHASNAVDGEDYSEKLIVFRVEGFGADTLPDGMKWAHKDILSAASSDPQDKIRTDALHDVILTGLMESPQTFGKHFSKNKPAQIVEAIVTRKP
jgi:hypothetical protein